MNKDIKIIEDSDLLINARNPQGKLGNELIDKMNVNHEGLAKWSLSHLDISKDNVILDIGCGGGVNVKRFLKMTENKVYGIDYSELAVKRSIKLNKSAVDEGKCEIIKGSVSDLPFNDNSFDIVTGFETVYFWPDFSNDLKEVLRVLKDNGIIFIANEALPKEGDERQKELIELLDMKIYSEDELVESLKLAGFSKVTTYLKDSKDSFTGEDAEWICVIAQK
ncbi:MAG: class I SAM-dependent methyltransferase [Methanobrevibacter sp.]|uniref:class I SAM-dependent methyltransferase n=1 Tax=Methanobrevibacter sp. TaxID=66852 RepID=UPI0025D95487|nr:class I SAM-dependent methyltransferase [Methanobrevibacter sp.]MBR3113754.1 class I SAM-dependent methyltransferase [Methanobrevibacter sp.]